MLTMNLQLFAHKKGTGSSHNGRDSESKRLGAKRADGQFVPAKIANLRMWKPERGESRGQIEGRDLVVVADGVKEPKKLRYLFSHPWRGSLYNEVNLPLGAFHIGE